MKKYKDIEKYSFSKRIAKDVGFEEAFMFHNIYFWVKQNQKKNRNMKEGKYWTYNSIVDFAIQFPFWSTSQLRRILLKLKKKGYIDTGRFNRMGSDKTTWYTVTEYGRNMVENTNASAETNNLE